MRLGIGMHVEKGVWDHDLWFSLDDRDVLGPRGPYAAQIMATCTRCGQALPQKQGRRDREWKDDISPSSLTALAAVDSPMETTCRSMRTSSPVTTNRTRGMGTSP
jgi:hypothetical protein